MLESLHQYVCPFCRIPIVGRSLNQLCINLNEHNDRLHPSECCRWSDVGLSCSSHYTAPEDDSDQMDVPLAGLSKPDPTFGTPMPQYTTPHSTCKNSSVDPLFPKLTRDDLDFLKEKHVKWL